MNSLKRFRRLFKGEPTLVATVQQTSITGNSAIVYLGGGSAKARNLANAVPNDRVIVKGGEIIGKLPQLSPVTVEV
jgi:hypothetical protein